MDTHAWISVYSCALYCAVYCTVLLSLLCWTEESSLCGEPQRVFSGERKSHNCVVNQQVSFCGDPKSHYGEPKSHHYEYYTVYCTLFPRVPKYFSNPLGHPLFNAQYMRFSCCGYTCSERFIFLTCHALKRGRPDRLLTQFLLKFARCAHFNTNVHPQTHGNTHIILADFYSHGRTRFSTKQ